MLKEYSLELHERLKNGLAAIAAEKQSSGIKLRDQLSLIRSLTAELISWVKDHPLTDQAEEIYYYKFIYPRFKAQLILHVELYNLQLNAPSESPGLLISHYRLYFSVCLEWVEQFKFYNLYRRMEAEELDELYFTASGDKSSSLIPVLAEADEYGTAVGFLYSKFLAYELLQDFIVAELGKMTPVNGGANPNDSRFKWTGKTIDLIEVAHGLHLQGAINKGEAGIVDFFTAFGDFFGVDLGIPKKGLDNLMDRKNVARTRFTDKMRQSLHGKMDELEKYDPDRIKRKMGL